MKNRILLLSLFSLILLSCNNRAPKSPETTDTNNEKNQPKDQALDKITNNTIEFPSLDGLPISAKLYEAGKDLPVILLCHQARFNKFEYEGIAQKLNAKGFNCLAIDQRSGGPIANQTNETTVRALKANKSIDFLDAEQDMIAAINYAAEKYKKPIILWGSSYSSTLALYLAIENDNVAAVVSFSPGDYFAEQKGSLIEKLASFQKPMFITSSKQEIGDTKALLENVELNDNQVHFMPVGNGHHGSRALWGNQIGGEEYWEAIDRFLKNLSKVLK